MPDIGPRMFRVQIKGTVDQVWREITRTDEPILAFFNAQMHLGGPLGPGSRIAMRSPDGRFTVVVGEIVECTPMRRFSHTFRFTAYDDPECVVIYDLKPVEGGVEFTLTIDELPEGTKTGKQMIQGGGMIVKTLKSVIETGRPTLGVRILYAFFALTAPFTPKRCRSEHWPIGDESSSN